MSIETNTRNLSVLLGKILLTQILLSSFGVTQAAEEKYNYPKEAIVQEIIDHDSLQPYLHPDIPNRVPLVISDHLIDHSFKLKKFGQKVLILADAQVKAAYLRFTAFDCKNGNYCNISFEYPIEDITGGLGVWVKSDGYFKFEKVEISKRSSHTPAR